MTMYELPKDHVTVSGALDYSTTDTGDRFIAFRADSPDSAKIKDGVLAGMIIRVAVSQQSLDQLLGNVRDAGGVRFV